MEGLRVEQEGAVPRHLVHQDVVLGQIGVHQAAVLVQLAHKQHQLSVEAPQLRQPAPRVLIQASREAMCALGKPTKRVVLSGAKCKVHVGA